MLAIHFIYVRATAGGKGQAWRGDSHGMAHTGKAVAAGNPHEQPG